MLSTRFVNLLRDKETAEAAYLAVECVFGRATTLELDFSIDLADADYEYLRDHNHAIVGDSLGLAFSLLLAGHKEADNSRRIWASGALRKRNSHRFFTDSVADIETKVSDALTHDFERLYVSSEDFNRVRHLDTDRIYPIGPEATKSSLKKALG